jgi:hypothetical protein
MDVPLGKWNTDTLSIEAFLYVHNHQTVTGEDRNQFNVLPRVAVDQRQFGEALK